MEQKSIAVMIKIASIKFEKWANLVLAPYDLTFSQYKVLKLIFLKPEEKIRQLDIENFFYMSNPTVTGILNNLEKKGMIVRVLNPDDHRSRIIQLTKKTLAMKYELIKMQDQLDEGFIADLSPKEREQMSCTLKKLISK